MARGAPNRLLNLIPVYTRPLAKQWQFLLTPPLAGTVNMAVDMAMMNRARDTGCAVCRVYTWAAPTVSFGRNQAARGWYDPAAIASRGFEVVRRPTGGRAILHHREITYSVAAPATVSLREAYARINALLLSALMQLGVPAEVAEPGGRARRPDAAPCFEAPSAGEMTAGGGKLVGSAQWREEGALLQHGSILVEDDQRELASLAFTPTPPMTAPATLSRLLGRVPRPDEFAAALFESVRVGEDAAAVRLDSDQAIAEGARFVADFADPEWTWRR